MRADEIARFSGQVIDRATLDAIKASENVKTIKDCGIDGRHLGKNGMWWYFGTALKSVYIQSIRIPAHHTKKENGTKNEINDSFRHSRLGILLQQDAGCL